MELPNPLRAWPGIVAILCAALAAPAALAQDAGASDVGVSKDAIKIGATGGITGAYPMAGRQFTGFMKRVFDKTNAAGGIHGRKIQFTVMDDGADGKRAIDNAQALVREEKVFIMTSVGTTTTPGIMRLLESQKVPLVFPLALFNDLITPPKDGVYAFLPLYHQQSSAIVEWGMKKKGPGKVVIIRANAPVWDPPTDAAAKKVKELGGEVAGVINTEYSQKEWGSVVIRLKELAPDYLMVLTTAPDQGRLYAEMKRQGFAVKKSILGTATLADQAFLDAAGSVPDGLVYASVPATLIQTAPEAKVCQDLWPDEKIGVYGIEGCAAGEMIVETLQKLGPQPTRANLNKMLSTSFGPFKLPYTGVFKSSPDHLLAHGMGVATVEGGKFVSVGTEIIEAK
ncbi:ABC transporter substrate-binding protein [Ramlibacter sp. G-1-2-2]|uniref:ABC transporter substrate-binding protein n=1 Tax=Ramlibacter agri TaxID=2728837 RepID=A0A848H4I8_9BURK|nr:ABC transporter substrate-binding protein [Ramlibacter agri]NML45715.1 ABC transporter substrate-binding protein [Ramlibacter agri]